MKRACFLLLFLAAPLTAQPVFEITSVDLGDIAGEDKVSTVFQFENTGEHDVWITEVHPSCGCTIPGYTETPVAPGETGVVNVDYDPRARFGSFRHSVVVHFEDGSDNEIREVIFVEGGNRIAVNVSHFDVGLDGSRGRPPFNTDLHG